MPRDDAAATAERLIVVARSACALACRPAPRSSVFSTRRRSASSRRDVSHLLFARRSAPCEPSPARIAIGDARATRTPARGWRVVWVVLAAAAEQGGARGNVGVIGRIFLLPSLVAPRGQASPLAPPCAPVGVSAPRAGATHVARGAAHAACGARGVRGRHAVRALFVAVRGPGLRAALL